MKKEEILNELTEIFREEFDRQDIEIDFETTADDVEEWNSLSHIQLIVSCEKFYNIKFNASEITSFKNVGDLCESIFAKM